MGLCQGGCEKVSRLCHGKAPETIVEYQNIVGMRTSFVSSNSRVGSRVSLKKSQQPSDSLQNSRTRQALNDIYSRLNQLNHKFDSVGQKLALDLDDEELVAQLQDIVFRTQLIAQPTTNKNSGIVFHSQDVSKAIPVRFGKRERSATFANRLNGLHSTVVDRMNIKQTVDIDWKSENAD